MPNWLFKMGQPIYHYTLSLLAALVYRFPASSIKIVFVTGTKGKTSTVELLSSILETAGHKTASSSTIFIKIGDKTEDNLYKMTAPGRFFVQMFLRKAVNNKCEYAVIEMTSQAVVQYRHRFINYDGLIFTNIAPEHIESHGSFENYLNAKLELARALGQSNKRPRITVSNLDDEHGEKFLSYEAEKKVGFRLSDWSNYNFKSELIGDFNKYNILGAVKFAEALNIPADKIKQGIEKVKLIPGRLDYVYAGQPYKIVVDYATTADSLKAVYSAFPGKKLICVLGCTGGGRDQWKRPLMASIAEAHCERVILTNEDPYDEDPEQIIEQLAKGIKNTSKLDKILDRRQAIKRALEFAEELAVPPPKGGTTAGDSNVAVMITGRGTDPYITHGDYKEPWSDKDVAFEEYKKLAK